MGKVLKAVAIAAVVVGVAAVAGAFTPVITATAGTATVGATATMAGVTIGVTTVTVGGMSAIGSAILAFAASTVLSGVSAQLFGPKMPKAQSSRLNPTFEPQAHRKFVFGQTAMNTDIRYYETSGTDQEYFDYIIATSAHEVESIDEIWFDDGIAWSSGSGVAAKYSGYLTVSTRTVGTSANTISINGGSIWGSSCRLTGCSYIYLRIKRTGNDKKAESPLVNGLPPRLTIKGKGAKIYDPRLDSTVAGGSGTHRANDQTTWGTANSTNRDNPALQLLWFLLGWNINGKLSVGCGVPYQRLDLPSFITAANICDEPITLAAGGTQPRYRTAGVGSDADNRMEIIQILLGSMNATLRDSNGKLSLTVMKNDLATPVLTFDDDDILGDFAWNQTRGLDEMVNAVHGKYTDPSDNSLFQPVEYPTISITSIDGIERMQTFDMPWVQEGRRAQRIAKQVLQRAQYKGVFSASFTMKALGCEVGDIVYLTFTSLGWVNKPFRVLSQGINSTGQVPMTMIEENAAIYAWDASEQAVVTATAPTVYDVLNNPLILAIEDATALADGKITSFYQTTAPVADGVGDIWIDTDDSNKMYRWDGTSWVLARDTGITYAISSAADAQATADGKIVTFYQASPPVAEAIGDLWIDSDDSNKLYRWNGSSWISARDAGITAAIAAAANAQATADGKIETFYQTTMPTGTEGDLWFDTDDGNKLYRHNGTTFVTAQDVGIGQAITAAADAQATADGKVTTFYSTTTPTAEAVGDLWYSTSTKILKRWNGSAWVDTATNGATASEVAAIAAAQADADAAYALADGKIETFFQASMPTTGTIGDLWFDTDDGYKIYRHNGTTFVTARDTGIATAINSAAGAQATADGKVTTFYSSTTPTATAVGDLWYDTTNGFLKRWSGTSWLNARDSSINTNGTIATDKVITGSILNNAVTVPLYAYTSAGIVIASYQTIQSVSITTSGSVVKLDFAFLLTGNTSGCNFRLTRNGTDVIPVSALSGGSGGLVSFTIGDSPAAGTYTYALLAQASGTAPLALMRSLFAMEIKK